MTTSDFTIRLDEATIDALDRLAEQPGRSRDWLIVKAVEDYLVLNAWQVEKVEAGLAGADRGEFADAVDIEHLRRRWDAGKASGLAGELDFADLRREARARLARTTKPMGNAD